MLRQWLEMVVGEPIQHLQPMVGDASTRRYFRVQTASGTFVAMDASELVDSCAPYVAIANALRLLGLQAPAIIAADMQQGWLLVTDFGDQTYLRALTAANADTLYQRALAALSILQNCRDVPDRTIPPFTKEFMHQEWAWHQEWFLGILLGLDLGKQADAINHCYELIVESAVSQPQVFMHRDYHAGNLMLLSDDIGILDFQDAFIGPVTYDLASLLRDCYIDWPPEKVATWATDYLQLLQAQQLLLEVTPQQFLRWFDLMSMQRHLKALFTFARKHLRDKNSSYLKHIPRTLNYLIQTSRQYPEFAPLHTFLTTSVQPAFNRVMATCVQ